MSRKKQYNDEWLIATVWLAVVFFWGAAGYIAVQILNKLW